MVDISVMQRIQDAFARAMDLAAVTVDRYGKPITMPSNFRPLCKLIRSHPDGLRRCMACDSMGGHRAYQKRGPFCYVCDGGLLDAAAPIIVEDRYIGCVLCGQSIPADSADTFRDRAIEINVKLGLPEDEVRRAVELVPVVPRDRFNAAVEMLSVVANHIMELAMSHLSQARLLAEAQEKAMLEKALQEAHLSALKAQINPHFLFNSLALIGSAASEENAPKSQEIAYNLADLLRYSLRNQDSLVQIAEELEMIENYLAIQKLALGDRLKTSVQLDPELSGIDIPCMILQPLVENAVTHGAEPVSRPVCIEVKITRSHKRIELRVVDDGQGMYPDMVEALNERRMPAKKSAKKHRESIGLMNILQRLDGEFGNQVEFQVTSLWDSGTEVCISIPDRAAASIIEFPLEEEELAPHPIKINIGRV